jgi:ring-1,2-phenylacetyl-CoA epoxidase subunit PaaC
MASTAQTATQPAELVTYLLRLADTSSILSHRLCEWSGHAPVLEEDIALSNVALDLLGQARLLYTHAGTVEGKGRDEDQLAYLRDAGAYRNLLIAELPNGDFAKTIVRQYLVSEYLLGLYEALTKSADEEIAAIAAKAVKELTYHVRHTGEWVIRLGDGTAESHARAQAALDDLWRYTGEMFERDAIDDAVIAAGIGMDAASLRPAWQTAVADVLAEATLVAPPADSWMISGGRDGRHSEHLGFILADMQFLQRAYPGATW